METFTDDTIVALASFLSPHDMLNLALTCKRFGDKHGMDTKRSAAREEINRGSGREVRQRTESISLMEVAARTILHAKWTDEEMNALPRRGEESWIGLYQEFLKLFRLPLQFDKMAGDCFDYIEGSDKTKVCTNDDNESERHGTAICQNIMRSGKHYVSFQFNDDDPSENLGVSCGIMRPTTNDITSLEQCNPVYDDLSRFSLKDYEMLHSNNVDCCLFNTYTGGCLIRERWKRYTNAELMAMNEEHHLRAVEQHQCVSFQWREMEGDEASYKIGMVLDLDEGTLDVYKNDRRLGTMKCRLVGEYCWAVLLVPGGSAKVSVSISR